MLVVQTARFRSIFMKTGFIHSLYGNILTLVPSFWISNDFPHTMAQKHLPITDLNYLPTQLDAELAGVGLMHPPQLSAIHRAPIQSIPRWKCKPRTQALALGCRHPHPKQSFSSELLPRGVMFAYHWEERQLWPLVSSLTGTVCWSRKFNLPKTKRWFCRTCFNVHGCQFRKGSMEGQLGLTLSEWIWTYTPSIDVIWHLSTTDGMDGFTIDSFIYLPTSNSSATHSPVQCTNVSFRYG